MSDAKRKELKAALVQKLCAKHGSDSIRKEAIAREVETSAALRSGAALTPADLQELENAVAEAVSRAADKTFILHDARGGTSRLYPATGMMPTSHFNHDSHVKDATARMLNANVCGGGYSSSIPGKAPRKRTETWDRYRDVTSDESMIADFSYQYHLAKDPIKVYVEKALQLHDDRKGMPVVASPVWARVGSSKAKA